MAWQMAVGKMDFVRGDLHWCHHLFVAGSEEALPSLNQLPFLLIQRDSNRYHRREAYTALLAC